MPKPQTPPVIRVMGSLQKSAIGAKKDLVYDVALPQQFSVDKKLFIETPGKGSIIIEPVKAYIKQMEELAGKGASYRIPTFLENGSEVLPRSIVSSHYNVLAKDISSNDLRTFMALLYLLVNTGVNFRRGYIKNGNKLTGHVFLKDSFMLGSDTFENISSSKEIQNVFNNLINSDFLKAILENYLAAKTGNNDVQDTIQMLENIFVPDGKRQEIIYKLKVRAAFYLKLTLDEVKCLENCYEYRSKILHQSRRIRLNDYEKTYYMLDTIARRVVTKLIESNYNNFNEFASDIDKQIFSYFAKKV